MPRGRFKGLNPRRIEQAGAADDARALVAARDRHPQCSFCGIQLHRELTNLAFERGDADLIHSDEAGLGLLVRQLLTIDLGQTKLD